MIMLTFLYSQAYAEKAEDHSRIINIGILRSLDQDEYSHQMMRAYIFKYLNEISKQHHWQYKFDTVSIKTGREKLLRGELDFLVPVQKDTSVEEDMIFTSGSPGYGLLSIYGRRSDPKMTVDDAQTMNGKTI